MDITPALLSAVVGIVGVLVGGIVPFRMVQGTLRKINSESQKLDAEREKIKADTAQVITDTAKDLIEQQNLRIVYLEAQATRMMSDISALRERMQKQDSALWEAERTIDKQTTQLRDQDGRIVVLTAENVTLKAQIIALQAQIDCKASV